tara:strand:- start:1575 stop:1730 length:156 start_codon:yes stop_codon:yes gene_type:complete
MTRRAQCAGALQSAPTIRAAALPVFQAVGAKLACAPSALCRFGLAKRRAAT